MQSTAPLLIALWAFVISGEKLRLGQALGIAISLCGVLVIISRGDLNVLMHIRFEKGDLWLIAAMVLYTFYSALLAKRPKMSRLGFLAFSIGWGAAHADAGLHLGAHGRRPAAFQRAHRGCPSPMCRSSPRCWPICSSIAASSWSGPIAPRRSST